MKLTPREQSILALRRLPDEQIAERLCVSLKTVKGYRYTIEAKLRNEAERLKKRGGLKEDER